jgi:hypothetical protein
MAGIVKASIDLTKIPKDKIVKGKKGQYINIVVNVNNDVDQFGNQASVVVDQTKDERDAKSPKVYLGNGKIVWSDGQFADPAPRDENRGGQAARPQPAQVTDDLPF